MEDAGGGLNAVLMAMQEVTSEEEFREMGMVWKIMFICLLKEGEEQVATLAVSPKEYVVDAHTMSALGNGNADKGADVMDNVVENVRKKPMVQYQQPNEINGLAALRPMMERV